MKLRRPKDYVPLPEQSSAPAEEKFIPGIVSTNVPDTENKIFVGGLPAYLNEVCFILFYFTYLFIYLFFLLFFSFLLISFLLFFFIAYISFRNK